MIAVAESVESSLSTPLELLSTQLVRLSEQRGSTPVLITPSHLTLRNKFFVELVKSLSTITNRPIRIDWYRPVPSVASVVTDLLAKWRVVNTNRSIGSVAGPTQPLGMMQITASLGRPGGIHRDLVVGWCNAPLPLPPWATPIELNS
ncbi:MAG: hypothetical protein P1U77_10975 [Rubripirellula sp.]|jgi:hypothetical protein|nr:hypothetical protein [Planctomycetaceae bacterium]MDF1841951.1 hypothetical protein [Rubripirellula sp.]